MSMVLVQYVRTYYIIITSRKFINLPQFTVLESHCIHKIQIIVHTSVISTSYRYFVNGESLAFYFLIVMYRYGTRTYLCIKMSYSGVVFLND